MIYLIIILLILDLFWGNRIIPLETKIVKIKGNYYIKRKIRFWIYITWMWRNEELKVYFYVNGVNTYKKIANKYLYSKLLCSYSFKFENAEHYPKEKAEKIYHHLTSYREWLDNEETITSTKDII